MVKHLRHRMLRQSLLLASPSLPQDIWERWSRTVACWVTFLTELTVAAALLNFFADSLDLCVVLAPASSRVAPAPAVHACQRQRLTSSRWRLSSQASAFRRVHLQVVSGLSKSSIPISLRTLRHTPAASAYGHHVATERVEEFTPSCAKVSSSRALLTPSRPPEHYFCHLVTWDEKFVQLTHTT